MTKLAIIPGILISALLFVLLAASRLNQSQENDVTLVDVEILELHSPPAPPEFQEDPEQTDNDLPPPPTPDINLLESLSSLDQPPLQLTPNKISITTPVETFRQSNDVADIAKPIITPPKNVSRVSAQKNEYSLNELDSTPKVIKKGSFRWPRSVRGNQASIKMKLKITKTGDVEVLQIISSDLEALNKTAIRVATQTKFTPPRKNGKIVEATYTRVFNLTK